MLSSLRLTANHLRITVLFLPILMLGISGCDSYLVKFYFGDTFGKGSSSSVERSAEQLVMEGMQKMQKKDYEDAIKDFRQLKERYPYSKYAILAELKLGDAHFLNKDYADAAIAYEEFARLHPRNEVVPYVLYQNRDVPFSFLYHHRSGSGRNTAGNGGFSASDSGFSAIGIRHEGEKTAF